MSSAIFEIFSEELPATLQKMISKNYRDFVIKEFKKLNIETDTENITIGITPYRLILIIDNSNISEDKLVEFISITLKDFSKYFPRTMCYPQLSVRWLRPIRGIFACVDDKIIEMDFFGIKSSNFTFINKFNKIECNSYEDYLYFLNKEEIVIDYSKRVNFITKEIEEIEEKQKLKFDNLKLIEEIAGMSEYCIKPMVSYLDDRYNIFPFELIELVLRENQRYVVFKPNKDNKIMFLIFGDKITANKIKQAKIIKGHQKVVNARLDDALYYWQLDEKIKNNKEKLMQILSNKTFLENISWNEYLEEQKKLTKDLVENQEQFNQVEQLIIDTKLDLSTGVVAEFPELQGIIGSYYFKYNINPYILEYNNKKYTIEELLYYFIDRLSYIQIMYQQGKQPTGSGDKYKVKARMDDLIIAFIELQESYGYKNDKQIKFLQENTNIYNLFLKRFEKYIKDNAINKVKQHLISVDKYSFDNNTTNPYHNYINNLDKINIELFAKTYLSLLNQGKIVNISSSLMLIINTNFIKAYKRIKGYVKNTIFIDNNDIKNKVKEIVGYDNKKFSNDYEAINSYLDSHKIQDNNEILQALKWLETMYNNDLDSKFLEIV